MNSKSYFVLADANGIESFGIAKDMLAPAMLRADCNRQRDAIVYEVKMNKFQFNKVSGLLKESKYKEAQQRIKEWFQENSVIVALPNANQSWLDSFNRIPVRTREDELNEMEIDTAGFELVYNTKGFKAMVEAIEEWVYGLDEYGESNLRERAYEAMKIRSMHREGLEDFFDVGDDGQLKIEFWNDGDRIYYRELE